MEYSIKFEHHNGVFSKYLNNFGMKTFKAFSKHIMDVFKLKMMYITSKYKTHEITRKELQTCPNNYGRGGRERVSWNEKKVKEWKR
jgi:hypothetical protein